MEISKLQNPRTRTSTKQAPGPIEKTETVKEGSVTITKVDIKPKSSDRERFGSGTKNWSKFDEDTAVLNDSQGESNNYTPLRH